MPMERIAKSRGTSFRFGKEERLCKKAVIQQLFKEGHSFFQFPFKILTLPQPGDGFDVTGAQPHQVMVTVSSRNFSRSVDRNRVKRLVRETYRLQKHLLSETPALYISFMYTSKEIMVFEGIKHKMGQALQKIRKNMAEKQ